MILKTLLVANNCNWESMDAKMALINKLIFDASNGRLACEIDVTKTYFDNIPFTKVGEVVIVDRDWYKKNIAVLAQGYNFVSFLIPQVENPQIGNFGSTDGYENGLIQTEIKADENDTINSPVSNLFVNTFIHENFGHGLRLITEQPDFRPDGSFLVHDYLVGKFDLAELFSLLDYSKLQKIIGKPINIMIYDVYLPEQGLGFTKELFDKFNPEVQAAILFNNIGGKNIIVDGVITERDPDFIYFAS